MGGPFPAILGLKKMRGRLIPVCFANRLSQRDEVCCYLSLVDEQSDKNRLFNSASFNCLLSGGKSEMRTAAFSPLLQNSYLKQNYTSLVRKIKQNVGLSG
jgi:hypothetical protein